MDKLCSLIIRTRNEERWIGACLKSVFNQDYPNFEVIIVDNQSEDRTLEKARQYPISQVVTIEDYLPGKALNLGIRASQGDYLVCLSGHCIPAEEHWLATLVAALEADETLAGVYGRQEPMAFSLDADKRDLLLVFGLDAKIQVKDSFFHNANSILHRALWDQVPFSDVVTNIEDRLWAQEMLNRGYRIAYEPGASVYHHHGIHQNGDHERCTNVVRILESYQNNTGGGVLQADNLNIVAIIPSKGKSLEIGGRPVIELTIKSALASRYISDVFLATDDAEQAEHGRELGARVPFLRPASLSRDYVGLEAVYRYTLTRIEEEGIYPDLVVTLEPTYPFRMPGLIDNIIEQVLREGLDTVLAAHRETNSIWRESEGGPIQRIDSGYAPRTYKEKTLIGLKGLCCVTHPEILRQERLIGSRVGLYKVDYPLSAIEVRSDKDRLHIEPLMQIWADMLEAQDASIETSTG